MDDPKVPKAIEESLQKFRKDHPDPNRVGFLMMQFGRTRVHSEIVEEVRATLSQHNLKAVRADDKEYNEDLYYNILTYMYGCGFGIAVFERLETDIFNPNVSYEVGFMQAIGRKVCMLKDQSLNTLHTDLIGKLYRSFDPQEPSPSIRNVLTSWLNDYGFAKLRPLRAELKTVSGGRTSFSYHKEGIGRSSHQLRISKPFEREPEFTYFESTAKAPASRFEITFVFGLQFSFQENQREVLMKDLIESGTLSSGQNAPWIRTVPEPSNHYYVDLDALKAEFTELESFEWLHGEQLRFGTHTTGNHHDDPQQNTAVTLIFEEEYDEEKVVYSLSDSQRHILQRLSDAGTPQSENQIWPRGVNDLGDADYIGLHELRTFGYIDSQYPDHNSPPYTPTTYSLTDKGRNSL